MTMPHERTRALLWAGSLLVYLNYNKQLPKRLRRKAYSIGRHFPTEEEVRSFELLRFPHTGREMFAPISEVPDWRDAAMGQPLTYSIRFVWPEDDANAPRKPFRLKKSVDAPDFASRVAAMVDTRQAYEQHTQSVYRALRAEFPEIDSVLGQLEVIEALMPAWACRPMFDDDTKSAAELLVEGRVDEVMQAIHRSTSGSFS